MLVLSRRFGEQIVIELNDRVLASLSGIQREVFEDVFGFPPEDFRITTTLLRIGPNTARIGTDAPASLNIVRVELKQERLVEHGPEEVRFRQHCED